MITKENVRIVQEVVASGTVYESTADIGADLAAMGLSNAVQEEVWVVTIDGSRQVRRYYTVAKGNYHDCDVSLPALLSPVFLSATDRFVVAHNHPSGTLEPTQHDFNMTWRIGEAADMLDLIFEDHLIVAPGGKWYSMRGHKQMRAPKSSKVAGR